MKKKYSFVFDNCTLEEIQNEIDRHKYMEKDKMNKFKIGDKVKLVRIDDINKEDKTKIGYTFIINKIDIFGIIQDENDKVFLESELELVSSQLTPKYKVGDKVKVIRGGVGKITKVDVYYKTNLCGGTYFDDDLIPYIEPKVKELTVAEISEKLGYEVKIVK